MAEQEIKRVNFFDGQFLKELEFQEEQKYHLHMRRRLSYILFNQSGVVLVNGHELTLNTDISTPAVKNFTVSAGMAISKDTDVMEGKEIILRQDITKSLDAEGIGSGQTAYITVHFLEEGAKDPPSEGDEDQDTRIKENAVINAHSTNPTGGTADNGEEYIVLGTINYDTMATTETGRQLTQINHHLVGAASASELVSIDITPALPTVTEGEHIDLTATGTFSEGDPRPLTSSEVTWTSSNNSIATVNANGRVTGVTDGSANITATSTENSTISDTVSVTVNSAVPAPIITNYTPRRGKPGRSVTILGSNFIGPSLTVTFDGENANILTGSTATRINTRVPTVDPNPDGKLRVSNDGGFAEEDFEIQAP